MQKLERIHNELERIAADASGLVGVSFCHVGSDQRLTLNAGELFPMASTYKVAIAATLLKLIDEQHFRLDEMIHINQDDLSPGSGIIRAHFGEPGVALSIHNLLTVMLTLSDNTASDNLWHHTASTGRQVVAPVSAGQQRGIHGAASGRGLRDLRSGCP